MHRREAQPCPQAPAARPQPKFKRRITICSGPGLDVASGALVPCSGRSAPVPATSAVPLAAAQTAKSQGHHCRPGQPASRTSANALRQSKTVDISPMLTRSAHGHCVSRRRAGAGHLCVASILINVEGQVKREVQKRRAAFAFCSRSEQRFRFNH